MLRVGTIVGGACGFVRDNIGLVLIWSVIYMVGAALGSWLLHPLFEAQLATLTADAPRLPEGLFSHLGLTYLILGVMFIILFAAAFRAVLLPGKHGLAQIRLGMDELRLFGLMLILLVLYLLAFVLIGIVTMIGGLLLSRTSAPHSIDAMLLLFYAAQLGGAAYISVRLSTAAPLTILRRRITIWDAWKLTRGRFWTLFLAYLIVLLIIAVPSICLILLIDGDVYRHVLVTPYPSTEFGDGMRAAIDAQSPGQPMWLLAMAVYGIAGGIAIALQGAMTAIATRALLGETEGGPGFRRAEPGFGA